MPTAHSRVAIVPGVGRQIDLRSYSDFESMFVPQYPSWLLTDTSLSVSVSSVYMADLYSMV